MTIVSVRIFWSGIGFAFDLMPSRGSVRYLKQRYVNRHAVLRSGYCRRPINYITCRSTRPRSIDRVGQNLSDFPWPARKKMNEKP